MKSIVKILKWLGVTILAIVIIGLIGYFYIYNSTEKRVNQIYQVNLKPLEINDDSATYALGKHLSIIKGCQDCHGSKFEGGYVINDPPVGIVYAPNLTRGKGGKVASYTDDDWIRSIKHGVSPSGKPLWIMPSYEYDLLSEEDLSALIVYLKRQEPIDSEPVANEIGPVGRVLLNFDKIPLFAAEKINHGPKESIQRMIPEETVEYGKYLAASCIGCHRDNLQGGPPLAPGFPTVPNITTEGNVGKYSESDFMQILRTGVKPNGDQINPKDMPWTMTKEFSDLEIKALYKYLQSLPEKG